VVFQRNPLYVGRSEAPSALSGNKQGKIERIEWLYLPDSNSSTAALKNGEVDMIEIVPPDYITQLGTDSNLKVASGGTLQGLVVMNHLHPPFNNASARQAVLLAVNQEKMTAALGYPAEMRMKYCGSYFICGGANDSAAGSAPYRNNDVARAKQLLANAGYKGEKVTLLMPTDIPAFNSASLVLAQALKGIGMNVDTVSMDWASITARRAKKDVPEQGGWNLYLTQAGEFDVNSPATSSILSAACGNSIPGWPCDKPLDELRAAWMKENVPAKRRELLDGFQARAFETVPYISFGQFTAAYAARKSIKNTEIMWGAIPTPWMLDK
jgi:peptide/nickel transport system substrate-binding protein